MFCLQIHTRGLDKCYTSEEAAQQTCVAEQDILDREASEVMLYRTKGFLGEPAVSPTYCPFNGAYTFTYSINQGGEGELECGETTSPAASTISDCPYGFGLNLQFRSCSFLDRDASFHCLGDWAGRVPGTRYLALMDTGADQGPRYRCALYQEAEPSGVIQLALSSDSTCLTNLHSASRGWETMKLSPRPAPAWPASLTSSCVFPDWLQGRWEHITFTGESVLYKDHRTFKTYAGRCVPHGSASPDRFLLYTRSQCGDQEYKCMWVKERGVNTMEVGCCLWQVLSLYGYCSDLLVNFPGAGESLHL